MQTYANAKGGSRIQFTVITAHDCELAKQFAIGADGKPESTAIAHMTRGHAEVRTIDDVTGLRDVLPQLTANQAITCGVPAVGDTPLTTRAGVEFNPHAVARTNEAFRFPFGATLFPIDVDVDGDAFQSVGDVMDALEACSPWLKWVLRVGAPSSSSYVDARGLRGVHVYLAVTRGTDISALAERMQIEQWAADRGFVKISRSGALLVRQLSDASVYQPSRLMFEAKPVLNDGIERHVPPDQAFIVREPQIMGRPSNAAASGALDVQVLPAVKEIAKRRFETAKKQAKDARRAEAKRLAIEYQKDNAIAAGLDAATGERFGLMATRALGDRKLPAAWPIHVKDTGRVTVAELLANLPKYLKLQCADPFDTWRPDLAPKHCGKAEIVMMGDTPGVWSHKLQTFFEFTRDTAADLATPLARAAEKLCGVLDYPERVGKKAAPYVNIRHGLGALLDEIGARPRMNACTGEVEIPDDLRDIGALVEALSRVGCAHVMPGVVERALADIAQTHLYDPWKDRMEALPEWDGEARLDTFFGDYCGADPSPALTLTAQLFFAGIVMRQLAGSAAQPVVPVLIGKQRCGKSQLVRRLAAGLGFDEPTAIKLGDPREMCMKARVSPIVEIEEMNGLNKAEVEEVKAWTAATIDRYRKPYGRDEVSYPRRFSPIGTSNKYDLNRDETGNSRFMPVIIPERHKVPFERAEREAPQIFAEARERFVADPRAYQELLRAAPDAVLDHNARAMRAGEGTPDDDVCNFASDIVRQIVREQAGDATVNPGQVANRIVVANASAKGITPQRVSRWMALRGWEKLPKSSVTRYRVPDDFLHDDASADAPLPAGNPFTPASPSVAVH